MRLADAFAAVAGTVLWLPATTPGTGQLDLQMALLAAIALVAVPGSGAAQALEAATSSPAGVWAWAVAHLASVPGVQELLLCRLRGPWGDGTAKLLPSSSEILAGSSCTTRANCLSS